MQFRTGAPPGPGPLPMTNRKDIQPSDESSRDKEARGHGSAAGNPPEVRQPDAEGGGIEDQNAEFLNAIQEGRRPLTSCSTCL